MGRGVSGQDQPQTTPRVVESLDRDLMRVVESLDEDLMRPRPAAAQDPPSSRQPEQRVKQSKDKGLARSPSPKWTPSTFTSSEETRPDNLPRWGYCKSRWSSSTQDTSTSQQPDQRVTQSRDKGLERPHRKSRDDPPSPAVTPSSSTRSEEWSPQIPPRRPSVKRHRRSSAQDTSSSRQPERRVKQSLDKGSVRPHRKSRDDPPSPAATPSTSGSSEEKRAENPPRLPSVKRHRRSSDESGPSAPQRKRRTPNRSPPPQRRRPPSAHQKKAENEASLPSNSFERLALRLLNEMTSSENQAKMKDEVDTIINMYKVNSFLIYYHSS